MPATPQLHILLTTTRLLAFAVALACVLIAPCNAQMLDLDSRREVARVTNNDVASHIAQLQAQIRDIEARAGSERNRFNRIALLAQVKTKQLAVQLLSTPDDVITIDQAQRVIKGMTLARGISAIDESLEAFAAEARNLEKNQLQTSMSQQALLELGRVDHAVRLLETYVAAPAPAAPPANPNDLQGYLVKHLHWLAAISHQPPPTVWPSQTPPPAGGQLTIEHISSLNDRSIALQDAWPNTPDFTDMLQRITPALQLPELHAPAANALTDIDSALDFLELVVKSKHLDSATRDALVKAAGDIVDTYAQPQSRPAASAHLANLVKLMPIIRRIDQLGDAEVDVKPIRDVLRVAVTGASESRSAAITQWLDRLTQSLVAISALPGATTVGDLRFTFVTLQRRHDDLLAAALTVARQLASQPDRIFQPDATASISSIESNLESLELIATVQRSLSIANTWNPEPAYGINQRIKNAARMLDTADADRTRAMLDNFVKQVDMLAYPPLADQLQPARGGLPQGDLPLVGDRGGRLLLVLKVNRKAFADAWATQDNPPVQSNIVLPTYHTFAAIDALTRLTDDHRRSANLNAWGAIDINVDVIDKAAGTVERFAETSIDALLSGDRPQLFGVASQTEPGTPYSTAILIAELLKHAPGGAITAENIYAQLLLKPPHDAILLDQQKNLAWFSILANERQAEVPDDDRRRRRLSRREQEAFDDQLAQTRIDTQQALGDALASLAK